MAVVRAGDLEVAYDDVGTGPPVLLVHGGLGNRAMWGPQVRVLAGGWRCLVPDLRGHGATSGDEGVDPLTGAVLAADLLAFLDALGVERCAVVGSSMGGFAAQELAVLAPERVERLVLADTWLVTAASEGVAAWGRAFSPIVEAALRALGTRPLAALAARGLGAAGSEAAELAREATATTSRETAVRVWRGVATHDSREAAQRIRVPTLVICGARDPSLVQARRLAALVPGARLEVLAGVGHNTNLAAADRFNALVEAFLA